MSAEQSSPAAAEKKYPVRKKIVAGALAVSSLVAGVAGAKALTAGGEHELSADTATSKVIEKPESEEALQNRVLHEYESALLAEDYSRMKINPGDVFPLGTNEEGKIQAIINPLLFESNGKDYVIYTEEPGSRQKLVLEYDQEKTTTFFLVDSDGKRYSESLVVDGAHNPSATEGTVWLFDDPHKISEFVQSQAEYYPDAHFTSIGTAVSIERGEGIAA